jgi:1-acyl-sn-glycerol-3-phosphate acyltransferase
VTWLRFGLGLAAAALFVLICAPLRRLAQIAGSGVGREMPVAVCRLLCRVLRVRVTRVGRPSPTAARLIVANHVSWLDIPVLGAIEPMAFLANKEVGAPRLGRQLALAQGVVFVDRQRKRAIPQVNAAMARAMSGGAPVVLFAEATTSDGTRLLPFRSSHFEAARQAGAGAVVQPVYLNFCRVAGMAVARIDRPLFAWYGDMAFLPSLWSVVFGGAVTCEVHYGEALPVAAYPNRKALTRAAERSVRALAASCRARNALQ